MVITSQFNVRFDIGYVYIYMERTKTCRALVTRKLYTDLGPLVMVVIRKKKLGNFTLLGFRPSSAYGISVATRNQSHGWLVISTNHPNLVPVLYPFCMVFSKRYLFFPSGKRLHNYGKSPLLIGKSTINGPFSIANCLPEGNSLKPPIISNLSVTSLGRPAFPAYRPPALATQCLLRIDTLCNRTGEICPIKHGDVMWISP